MGFFDIFRKKPRIAPDELVINVMEHSLDINGHYIEMPCNIKTLYDVLGYPRRFDGQTGNVNLTWDKLGVYCYVNQRMEVYCLAVKAHPDEIPAGFDPKRFFVGQLNICGEQWELALSLGDDLEIGRERSVGSLSLFGAYTDFENGDKNGHHGAYNGIEIQFHRN